MHGSSSKMRQCLSSFYRKDNKEGKVMGPLLVSFYILVSCDKPHKSLVGEKPDIINSILESASSSDEISQSNQ